MGGNSVGRLREDLRQAQEACARERQSHEATRQLLADARAHMITAQAAQRTAEGAVAMARQEAQRLSGELDTAIAQKQVLAEQVGEERAKRREVERALQEERRRPRQTQTITQVPREVEAELAALRNEVDVLRSQLAEARR